MTFTVEFVAGLANTAVDLMTVDISGLTAAATTINVVETQVGISDVPATPAINTITFGAGLESGDFSLQHPNINSGTAKNISINNVTVNLQNVTTGENVVIGPQAVYTLTLSSPPSNNYYEILYNNTILLSIDHTGTIITFNGQSYSSIQNAFAAYFGGTWTCTGGPQNPPIIFTGPSETFGTSPWTTQYDYWVDVGVTATPSFVDGFAGDPQTYVLTFDSSPGFGNFWLSYQGSYNFIFDYQGHNTNFNGHGPYSTIQEALNAISVEYGYSGGPWTCIGGPQSGTLTLYGPQTSIGSSCWSIHQNNLGVTVTDNWVDGAAASNGVNAVHSLALEGAFDGTFAINGFAGIPWNIDVGTLSNYWGNNTGQAVSPYITGSGTWNDTWTITYHDPGPVSLPTIDGSALVGFPNSYLQSQVGSNFIVSGSVANPYTLTSTTNGSGQTAITALNVNMAASISINQPITRTAGSAGTGGVHATYVLTIATTPTSGYITLTFTGIIFDIQINYDNTDINGDSIQTRLNNIGLGGWTYSGSPASHTMTFTSNAQQPFGGPWNCTHSGFRDSGQIILNINYTEGVYPTGLSTAVQTWVSPAHQGATGGTFTVTGDATTVGPCAWNISSSDLANVWSTATGHSLSFATGFGTSISPYEFHFSENLAITLPTIDGTLLTTDGTVSNDFVDGTTTLGQNEIQTVTLADSPTSGSWSISFNNDDTVSPLDHNIAEQDLQAALRANWGVSTINVSLSSSTYTIDFGVREPQFGTNTIQANGSGLTKGVTANIDRIQKGQLL